ncbi:MAG: site-2 protease family protein [Oscillospiraceae bacterium]|nr:site-2 protease family protein [Oscillospiraceae bacterium]
MNALSNWFHGINAAQIVEWGMFALAALLSISVHESAHALSAHWLGDDTAKRMGRISLNPFRHLDPVGFFMMVVAHFGWARPVPVDMRRFKNPKVGMALTALAGPLSNILLALISTFAFYLTPAAERSAGIANVLISFFRVMIILNTGLAVFNLIPVSPLDGSKILAIVLPDAAYLKLMRYERYGMLILIGLLFLNLLDKPLAFLQGGLLDGLMAVAEPLARWIAGA